MKPFREPPDARQRVPARFRVVGTRCRASGARKGLHEPAVPARSFCPPPLDSPAFRRDIAPGCLMNPTPASLMVAVCDQAVCVKINGRADFTCSVDLKKLILELW